ncbi:hypothetical protein KR222_004170, partial [Zaprionus bogoriensis]
IYTNNTINNTTLIAKLTIEDCLGCKQEHVQFPPAANVHLLLYSLAGRSADEQGVSLAVTPICRALQLLCSLEYASAESLQRMPQLQMGKSCVRMSFTVNRRDQANVASNSDSDSDLDLEPSTSQQAQLRLERRRKQQQQRQRQLQTCHVTVARRFDDLQTLDRVFCQINSGVWRELPIGEFHSMFFVQQQHETLELLRSVHETCANNWLKVIQADALDYSSYRDEGNPFETFAKLFERQRQVGQQQELLQQLTSNCLAASETTRLCERRFVLHIFERVRCLFEYITAGEYTVWFFVPRLNRYTLLQQVSVDDFDLGNVRTRITLSSDSSDFWSRADHNIMDILLVAFQMALAAVSQQSVLLLGRLEKLADFVCLQYMKAAFMNSVYASEASSSVSLPAIPMPFPFSHSAAPQKWICSRYLHRIIEAAKSLGLIVFIEYPCGLTLLPEQHRVIKCLQVCDKQTGAISWQIYPDVTKQTECDIELLKKLV